MVHLEVVLHRNVPPRPISKEATQVVLLGAIPAHVPRMAGLYQLFLHRQEICQVRGEEHHPSIDSGALAPGMFIARVAATKKSASIQVITMFVRPLPSIHAPLQRSRGWQLKQIIDTGHDQQVNVHDQDFLKVDLLQRSEFREDFEETRLLNAAISAQALGSCDLDVLN